MRTLLLPFLSFLLITSVACRHTDVTGVEVQYVEMNGQASQSDSTTHALIAPYKIMLDSEMTQIVAHSNIAMPKERDKLETLLGNFVADACLVTGNEVYYPADGHDADMCLLNNGGLRSSLPVGDITRGNIFELMPFDNEIVIVTISGVKMWELAKFIGARGGEPVAGISLGLKPDKSPGTFLVNGQRCDSSKTYKVMTSDYLANGGDKMDFLRDPIKLETTGYKIRDAILDYCARKKSTGQNLDPKTDGRIYYESK
jgi:2',3'-cyclic-nucleotide 2'-phosphodiesterase (5'-nucleotidase family)